VVSDLNSDRLHGMSQRMFIVSARFKGSLRRALFGREHIRLRDCTGVQVLDRSATPVLTYHGIFPSCPNGLTQGRFHNVIPDVFQQQIETLARVYEVVDVDALAARAASGRSVAGMAAITFDDAYRSVFEYAEPILRSVGVPATFFITGGLLEGKILWRDKVRLLQNKGLVLEFLKFAREEENDFCKIREDEFYRDTKNSELIDCRCVDEYMDAFLTNVGIDMTSLAIDTYVSLKDLELFDSNVMSLGNHTYSHYLMSSMSYAEQESDLQLNEAILGHSGLTKSRLLSIPNGGVGDYNGETLRLAESLGFSGCLLCAGDQWVSAMDLNNHPKPTSDIMLLNRFMPRNALFERCR
jgi:peptidoglycan/xylan/chitin deacetylase (PgdA/CDA1 family)